MYMCKHASNGEARQSVPKAIMSSTDCDHFQIVTYHVRSWASVQTQGVRSAGASPTTETQETQGVGSACLRGTLMQSVAVLTEHEQPYIRPNPKPDEGPGPGRRERAPPPSRSQLVR